MGLIIGTRQITPYAITRTAMGVEAVLHGEALLSLLNTCFYGAGAIEILGGYLNRHQMEVTWIEKRGCETRVTLAATEARQGFLL